MVFRRVRLQDVAIGKRIVLLVLLPILGMLGLSVDILLAKRQQAAEMVKLAQLASYATDIGGLVHELQKERAISTGHVTSRGEKFKSEFETQRNLTTAKRATFDRALGGFDRESVDAGFWRKSDTAKAAVGKLDAARQQSMNLTVSAADNVKYYTTTIAALLDSVAAIAVAVKHDETPRAIMGFVNLMQGKERAGQERAAVLQGLTA